MFKGTAENKMYNIKYRAKTHTVKCNGVLTLFVQYL